MEMNKIVGIDVLLLYPNFSEEFIIHTDSRKIQFKGDDYPKWESHCLSFM